MSLASEHSPLACPPEQLRILGQPTIPSFAERLAAAGCSPLTAGGIEVLQINMGKLCNQVCRHCHVDAGPDRREIMSRETAEWCVRVLEKTNIPTVDITGGAPELNPNFRWLVEQAKRLGRHVMDRCNLTVLLLPSQHDLAEFLARHEVEVIASLPYFLAEQTDAQRGEGVFEKSIMALRKLNALGYGLEGSRFKLNLVYNPVGAYLPPPQAAIEADFKRELARRYGIQVHHVYTITNMPISRFLDYLLRSGNYERYVQRLAGAFNPQTVSGLMCRYTLSVGWDGTLYDCDFNQMLGLTVGGAAPRHISQFDAQLLEQRAIVTGPHCYGCTAGTGSSCGGAIA